jgi:dihydrolipoamide dehydrogenase
MSKGVQFLMKKNKIDVVMGFGKLKAKGQVEVTKADGSKEVVEAKHIIIATGGRSRELPNLKQDGKKVIGIAKQCPYPSLPKSMIVVGSGAIGVEFAYFYNSMGTKVTVVEFLPRAVPVEDEDISKELEKQYKKNGIEIMTNASVESLDTSGDVVKAKVKTATGEVTLEAEVGLSAVGVTANLEGIGLEELGLKPTREGLPLINSIKPMFLAFMQSGIAFPVRLWRTLPVKKVLFVLKALVITKRNITTSRKHLIMVMFRDVRIVFRK